jgi:DNA topoisomerase 2-associated protein PAT1
LKSSAGTEGKAAPEEADLNQWTATFNHLISRLSGHFPSLFPSTRSMPFGPGLYTTPNSASAEAILDAEDEPVWHFLAALAVNADMHQQQQLVTEVRDKVLENVMKAKSAAKQVETQGPLAASVAESKIKNVNTFLHALGLDASQITVE